MPKIIISKEDHVKLKEVLDNRSEMLQFLSDSRQTPMEDVLDRIIFEAYNHDATVKTWFYQQWWAKRVKEAK